MRAATVYPMKSNIDGMYHVIEAIGQGVDLAKCEPGCPLEPPFALPELPALDDDDERYAINAIEPSGNEDA